MEKKIDLLLVNAFSWAFDKRPCYLPYGVLYLASYLRTKGISVSLYDRNIDYSLDPGKCLEYFNKINPPIVGISVLTGPVITDALKISRRIKAISPKTVIVWGGLHPTFFPKQVLKEKSVDFIIQGEGELALSDLCEALLNNKNYKDIKNLGFRNNGKLVINPVREERINLDTNYLPAWDLVEMKYYLAKRFFASRVLTLNSSRGCLMKCTFCFNREYSSQKWRGISAKNIKKQIEYLYKNYNINGIQFYEDSFDTDKKRLREFCDLMIRSGMNKKVKWSHFSNIPYFDRETVLYEMEAGLKYIEYGVESGSQRILDWIKKQQTVEQIKEVFDHCKAIGIKTSALFMVGFPDETLEELNMTVKLVEELPAHILIGTIYRPYPKTPLFDYCVERKKFKPPEKLEEQAKFYHFSEIGEEVLNLSNVPTKVLLNLQKRFYAKFALSEAALCLKELNFDLFFYYLKQQLNWKTFLQTTKSLITRMTTKDKVHAKQ